MSPAAVAALTSVHGDEFLSVISVCILTVVSWPGAGCLPYSYSQTYRSPYSGQVHGQYPYHETPILFVKDSLTRVCFSIVF